jgi:hypothetical protein
MCTQRKDILYFSKLYGQISLSSASQSVNLITIYSTYYLRIIKFSMESFQSLWLRLTKKRELCSCFALEFLQSMSILIGKIVKTHLHFKGFIYPSVNIFVSVNHLQVLHSFIYPRNIDWLMWFSRWFIILEYCVILFATYINHNF